MEAHDLPTHAPSVMTRYGRRISRDTVLYFLGTAAVLPLSLVNVAVFTRYLEPADYGDLAVLFVLAGSLTVLWNLMTLQGTYLWVFGAGDDADIGSEEGGRLAKAGTKRRALGTGALMTVLTVLIGTSLLLVAEDALRAGLVGEDQGVVAVRWALVSGAAGSIFRFVVGVPRMERRPVRFAVLNLLRPALALAVAIPLIVSGHGVAGALAGTAIGTLAASAVAIVVQARSYALALNLADARRIVGISASYGGLVLGLWAAHNVDVLILAHYATDADVGVYRLAARMAAIMSYAVGAFLVAWSPLERTSLFAAAHTTFGRPHVRGLMVTYYVVMSCWLVLGMSLAADTLVRIAPPAYAAGGSLVPPIAVGLALYGLFAVLGRVTPMRRRGLTYGGAAVGSSLILIASCPVLIPWLGASGAALALIVGMGSGCAFLAVLAHRANAVRVSPLRLGLLIVLTAGLLTGASLVGNQLGAGSTAIDMLVTLGVFPAVVLAIGVVPRSHLRPLVQIASYALRGDRHGRAAARELDALEPRSRMVLASVLRDGRSADQTATSLNASRQEIERRYIDALCRLAGVTPFDGDADAISAYLLSPAPIAERDAAFGRLQRSGVDALTVHRLEDLARQLSKLPKRKWPADDDEIVPA